MRFVHANKLEPGMITTKPIYNGNCLILASNHTITQDTINAIKRSNILGLYIYDEYSEYEELNQIIDDQIRYELIKEVRDFNIDQVIFLTNHIVDSILKKGDDLLIDINELINFDDNTYNHSINVSILATTCGVGLGLNNDELQYLALGAVLHDIGKRAIPLDIINKDGPLTDKERETIKEHPQIGYNMLYDNDNISAFVRSAILSHHENWDGTGYPRQLKEYDIPTFGMIIHVADVYDAMVTERSYKKAYKQQEAIEYLMGNCGTMFNLDIVQAFINYLVVYPVGTRVMLSDNRIARVVQNRRATLLRPVIVIEQTKEMIDLARDMNYLNLTIVDTIE